MDRSRKILILIAFCFSFCMHHAAMAQQKDSIAGDKPVAAVDSTGADSQVVRKHHPLSKPDKAALMSAILPGLGQVTHKDAWWHVPIIYAGFGVFGYFIYDNNNQYQLYRQYYQSRLKTDADTSNHNYDPYYGLHSIQWLLSQREYYRRNRDLSIILTVVWYSANIIDAYVAAHLRDFDISNDLSMQIEPLNISMAFDRPVVTCGLKFKLK